MKTTKKCEALSVVRVSCRTTSCVRKGTNTSTKESTHKRYNIINVHYRYSNGYSTWRKPPAPQWQPNNSCSPPNQSKPKVWLLLNTFDLTWKHRIKSSYKSRGNSMRWERNIKSSLLFIMTVTSDFVMANKWTRLLISICGKALCFNSISIWLSPTWNLIISHLHLDASPTLNNSVRMSLKSI